MAPAAPESQAEILETSFRIFREGILVASGLAALLSSLCAFFQFNLPLEGQLGYREVEEHASISIGAFHRGCACFTRNLRCRITRDDRTNHCITNPLSSGGTLDELALTTNSATATVSAGEVTPTPEPGTLALFGSGLVALGGLIRRKLLQV